MTTARTYEVLNGEHAVYPGHPLVVAFVIMSVYDTPQEALSTSKYGWPECVGSSDVPGAGDGAHAGADVCKMLLDGGTPDDAVVLANATWLQMVNPSGSNHPDAWLPGKEQADRFEERFKELAAKWGKQ